MKKYNQYIKEQQTGKLIFDGDVQFESDIDWNIVVDISQTWNNFTNSKIDESNFVKELINLFKTKKPEILEKCQCWDDLVKELNILQTDLQNSNSIYNKIYDICDKNLILLKT